MRTFRHPQGTVVRIRKGSFPLDPTLVGRVGVVVQLDEYHPDRYGVVLEGESEVREFREDELTRAT